MIFNNLFRRKGRTILTLLGIATGVAAIIVLYLLAFHAIVAGILELVAAFGAGQEVDGRGWFVLGGVLSLVFGAILLSAPFAFGLLLVRILGVYALLFGVLLAILAFRVRKERRVLD